MHELCGFDVKQGLYCDWDYGRSAVLELPQLAGIRGTRKRGGVMKSSGPDQNGLPKSRKNSRDEVMNPRSTRHVLGKGRRYG